MKRRGFLGALGALTVVGPAAAKALPKLNETVKVDVPPGVKMYYPKSSPLAALADPSKAEKRLAKLLGMEVKRVYHHKYEWSTRQVTSSPTFWRDGLFLFEYNYTQIVRTVRDPGESTRSALRRHIRMIKHVLEHGNRYVVSDPRFSDGVTVTGGRRFWNDSGKGKVAALRGRALGWMKPGEDFNGAWLSDIGYIPSHVA